MVRSNDVDLHIRLVELYASSGKQVLVYPVGWPYVYLLHTGLLQKAFEYCNVIRHEGHFIGSLRWQQCTLSVAEVSC